MPCWYPDAQQRPYLPRHRTTRSHDRFREVPTQGNGLLLRVQRVRPGGPARIRAGNVGPWRRTAGRNCCSSTGPTFSRRPGFDCAARSDQLVQWRFATTVTLDDGGWAMFVKVNDEAVARREDRRPRRTAVGATRPSSRPAIPMLTMLAVTASPADDDRLPDFESLTFMISHPSRLVWGVIDGQLVIASSADDRRPVPGHRARRASQRARRMPA